MPLPVRVPCEPCGGDRLHVYDSQVKGWKCNDCGLLKLVLQPRPIDEYVRRQRAKHRHTPDSMLAKPG